MRALLKFDVDWLLLFGFERRKTGNTLSFQCFRWSSQKNFEPVPPVLEHLLSPFACMYGHESRGRACWIFAAFYFRRFHEPIMIGGSSIAMSVDSGCSSTRVLKTTPRSHFPETWLWDQSFTGYNRRIILHSPPKLWAIIDNFSSFVVAWLAASMIRCLESVNLLAW